VTLFYLDSSAWLKRYFLEPGSDWIMSLFQSGDPLADAVHSATAFGLNDALVGTGNSLVLISSDEEMLAVAQQTGLAVENPATAASP